MLLTKFHIALIPMIVLLLVSCKTPQQTTVQDQQSLQESVKEQEQQIHNLQLQMNLLRSQVDQQKTEANRHMESKANDVSETITEEFDTTQPVDSSTGTPPLKSRKTEKHDRKSQTTSTEKEETHTTQQATSQSDLQQSVMDSITNKTDIDREKENQSEAIQKTGLNWWQTTLCTIGGFCLLALLVWFAIKIIKRYVKPF